MSVSLQRICEDFELASYDSLMEFFRIQLIIMTYIFSQSAMHEDVH